MADEIDSNLHPYLTEQNRVAIAELLDGVDEMVTTHNAQVKAQAKREALQIMAVAIPILIVLLLIL